MHLFIYFLLYHGLKFIYLLMHGTYINQIIYYFVICYKSVNFPLTCQQESRTRQSQRRFQQSEMFQP